MSAGVLQADHALPVNPTHDFTDRLHGPVQSELARVSVRQSFQKGDYLLRAGDVCRCSYQIDTGLARNHYPTDGREVRTECCFPNDPALSLTSYTRKRPAWRPFSRAKRI